MQRKLTIALVLILIVMTAFLLSLQAERYKAAEKQERIDELVTRVSYLEKINEELLIDIAFSRSSTEPLATPIPEPTVTPTPEPTVTPTPEPTKCVGNYSAAEHKLFIQIVSAEAGAKWEYKGFMLLAQTTVNQWMTGDYGKTLHDTLTKPGNYSVYSSGRYKIVPISELATKAVDAALSGETIMPRDVLYYCTDTQLAKGGFHSTRPLYTQYKNVCFFR